MHKDLRENNKRKIKKKYNMKSIRLSHSYLVVNKLCFYFAGERELLTFCMQNETKREDR